MRLIRLVSCLPAAVSLVACTSNPTPPPARSIPDYLQSPTGCAVVAGGDIGSRFDNKQVAENWRKVNAAITTELYDRLVANKYRVTQLLVPGGRTRPAHELVFDSLAGQQCNRVLQVAHKVAEDASGKYFQFDITLFRAMPKPNAGSASDASTTVVATSEYERSYRYPRTQQSFENFYTGTFADQVLADLVAAQALSPLR